MKILVPIAKVPDTTSKISFTDNNTRFNPDGVTFIMNPTDEWYALVRACELKEKQGGEVVVIHVGTPDAEQIIRKALAIGADRAVRVDADPTDAYFVAAQIAAHAKAENYDLIITGKETIDYNSFQVGGMVSEMLDWPCVSLVQKLEVENGVATLRREIEGGSEIVEVKLPLVVCAQKELAEPRIPNMKGIMSARTKPLAVVPPVEVEKLTAVISYSLPEKAKQVKLIDKDNVAELIRLLHEEAKVI
ncbi:MAG: electron transfer flavoprotein subunit beta/FixA family protein [Chitinophagales bacterium]|nr:electron transfer flavoprotein subunit beta/FixA family protein [Chitinophagales bacterium]MDW8418932.1 electron transfer flavoprotein subunit beta/FixA family protein [Chitinophagales bacterium]